MRSAASSRTRWRHSAGREPGRAAFSVKYSARRRAVSPTWRATRMRARRWAGNPSRISRDGRRRWWAAIRGSPRRRWSERRGSCSERAAAGELRFAKLGGLALIGGLAYRAFRNYQSGEPLLGQGRLESPELAPGAPHLDPSAATDEDAMLFVRAMTAAVTADGHMDEGERERVTTGVTRAGLDREGVSWLANELANPPASKSLRDRRRRSKSLPRSMRLRVSPSSPIRRRSASSFTRWPRRSSSILL